VIAAGFSLVTQPIRPVERAGARFTRLPWSEVLMRPIDGTPPDQYVARAYAAGKAVELDMAVVRAAFPRMRRHCHYSINLALESLATPSFVAGLVRLLADRPPNRLVIEIVEREQASSSTWTRAATALADLRANGALAVALDDLAEHEPWQLIQLRGLIDVVKFDCRATATMLATRTLAPLAVDLLRALGGNPEIVAEGIEDAAAFAALRTVGPTPVAYWQGFYDGGIPADMAAPTARANKHHVTSTHAILCASPTTLPTNVESKNFRYSTPGEC